MFTYRVKERNGKTIRIESKEELDQKDINEFIRIYKQEQLQEQPQEQPQAQAQPQDESLAGRLANWHMAAEGRREKRRETFDKLMKNSVTKSLAFQMPAIGAALLTQGASLPVTMALQAGLGGGGAYLDKRTNDETVGDSAKTGLATGAIAAGLEVAPPVIKYTGKGIKMALPQSVKNLAGKGYRGVKNLAGKGFEAGKGFIPEIPERLLGLGAKLPKEGVNRVIENPNIITQSPKQFGEIATKLNNEVSQLQDIASEKFDNTVTNLIKTNKTPKYVPTEVINKRSEFEKGMGLKDKVSINPKGKKIITDTEFENIGNGINRLQDIDFNKLVSVYEKTQKASATPVTGAFSKLINNESLTIPEVLEVNRFISAIEVERNRGIAEMPNIAVNKLSRIKSLMKKNIDNSDMPDELKEAWNQYRIDLEPINQMENLGLIAKKTGEVGIENINSFMTKTIDNIKSPQKERANLSVEAMEQMQANLGQPRTYGNEFLDEAVKNLRQKQATTGITNLSEIGVILAHSKPVQMGAGALTGNAIAGPIGGLTAGLLPLGLSYLRNPNTLQKLAKRSKAIRKGEITGMPSIPKGLSDSINKAGQNVRQAKQGVSKVATELMEDKSGTFKPTVKALGARALGGNLTDNKHKKILRERGLIK